MKTLEQSFHGFRQLQSTQVPDELFDELMSDLSGAELKVLLYIIRRTFGFKKNSDNISLNQICHGIITREGKVLDKGTGLSLSTVQAALKGLLAKHCVVTVRNKSREKGDMPTTYSLNFRPLTENQQRWVPKIGNGGYRKSVPQETVEQETDLQFRNSKAKRQEETLQGTPPHQPSRAGKSTPSRTGVPSSVAAIISKRKDTLVQNNLSISRPKLTATPQILAVITEISEHFGDTNHLRSNTSQAANLWQASGRSEAAFVSTLYEAQSITRQQAKVHRPMPYFWRVTRDLLGLADESSSTQTHSVRGG